MAIIIILICLFLQKVLLFDRYAYQLHWLEMYFTWITNRVEYITEGHVIISLLILLIPVVIGFNLFFVIAYHLGGIPVYFILNLILVWLCLDARHLIKKPYANASVEELFILTYERLFAVIFWFIIFGPSGLILYSSVICLRNFLLRESHPQLFACTMLFKNILDWVPIRLLSLSYAIAGNFSSVSQVVRLHLKTGLSSSFRILIECGCAALGLPESTLSNHSLGVINLINRTLLFWLTLIALLTIVFYI